MPKQFNPTDNIFENDPIGVSEFYFSGNVHEEPLGNVF